MNIFFLIIVNKCKNETIISQTFLRQIISLVLFILKLTVEIRRGITLVVPDASGLQESTLQRFLLMKFNDGAKYVLGY